MPAPRSTTSRGSSVRRATERPRPDSRGGRARTRRRPPRTPCTGPRTVWSRLTITASSVDRSRCPARLDQAGDPADLLRARSRRRRRAARRAAAPRRGRSRARRRGCPPRAPGAFSMRLRPLFDARKASSAPLHVAASRAAATAASVRSHSSSSTMRPATYASSSASVPWTPAHTTTTSSPASRAASTTAERLRSEAMSTRSQRAAADTTARVPFVVERISVSPAGSRYSRGEFPRSKPGMRTALTLAAEHSLAERVAKRASLLHLSRAEHPPIAGRKRLADRRGGADDVDHDPGRGRSGLVRGEDDVDSHAGTLAAVDEPLRCYRHPDRETYVSCSECGRGICPDCMTYGPGRHPLPGSRDDGRQDRGAAPAQRGAHRSRSRCRGRS